MLALLAVGAIRFAQHRQHISDLEARRNQSRAIAQATSTATNTLDGASTRYFARVKAFFSSLDGLGNNGIGYLAVVRQRIAAQLDDESLTRALQSVPRRIAADGEFSKSRAAFATTYEGSRDQLTSFSATLGAILSSPILAIGLSGNDGAEMGRRVGKAEIDLKVSWNSLSDRAHALSENAKTEARADQVLLDEVVNRGFPQMLVKP